MHEMQTGMKAHNKYTMGHEQPIMSDTQTAHHLTGVLFSTCDTTTEIVWREKMCANGEGTRF